MIFLKSKKLPFWKTILQYRCYCRTCATMTQPKNQNIQEIFLDWRKAFEATDHEVLDRMTVTWGVPQRSTEEKFFSQIKNYWPKVPEHLQFFMLSDDKSVVALNGTAENKESQSMETQNWLTARKQVVKLNKTAGYHGKFFGLQTLLMKIFRKKRRSLDKK